MNYQVLKLETPKKLCVICQRTPESCMGEKDNHIQDTIGYRWVIADEDTGQPVSFHFTRADATRARRALHGTTG